MAIEPPSSSARILIIDDEPQIRRLLDISLRAQGYEVRQAEDGKRGLQSLAQDGADLMLLDIGLPDTEGHQVLQQVREWSQVPVIMLTVRDAETEKVAALDAGANDYVTKPFGTRELMARIRVLLRQNGTEKNAATVYDDGELHIDLGRREVLLRGERLQLARKEYALLALLLKNSGRVVTQPQILREIWGKVHDDDLHYVRVLVGKLRQRLGDNAAAPRWLATEPGVGLRFVAQEPTAVPGKNDTP